MAQGFRLPAYDANALLNFKPINDAIDVFYQQRQQGIENERQNKLLQFQEQRVGMDQGRYGMDQQRFTRDMGQRDLLDPIAVRQAQLGLDTTRASIGQTRAQTDFIRARERALSQPQPVQQSDPVQSIPDGVGLNAQGELVDIRQMQRQPQGFNFSPSDAIPARELMEPVRRSFPPPMRLGGPREEDLIVTPTNGGEDSIAQFFREQAGRQPQGVRVAQSGGAAGAVFGDPSLMEQTRTRNFGARGMTPGDVPGVVLTTRGRSDAVATREAAGQRAIEESPEAMRSRLMKLRSDQERWTAIWKKPARAGYYYNEFGEEKQLSDRRSTAQTGEDQLTALGVRHRSMIDEAHKTLMSTPGGWLGRAVSGNPTQDGFGGMVKNAGAALLNSGDTAQAFSDFKQIAMQPAYLLSGKTVAVAEMKNFLDAYAPRPNDTERQIDLKVARIKSFYDTLLEARKKKGTDLDVGDISAAAAAGARTQSQPAPQPQRPANPGQDRLKSKYGLE